MLSFLSSLPFIHSCIHAFFPSFPFPSLLDHLVDARALVAIGSGGAIRLSREVLEGALGIGLHALGAGLPVGGADLAVLVGELEGLDEAQGLVDGAAHGQVVDGDLAQDALGVDDEQAAQGHALVLEQHPVLARDGLALVRHERQAQVRPQPALLARLLRPRQVREVRVRRDPEHRRVHGRELRQRVVEAEDLRRAHEGEVQRVEEEYDPVLKGKRRVSNLH